ncbi:MAG: hypothetical protein ABR915_16505 [Thermoguttaceae bacterium]|jgi:hypothetical protein
MGISRSGVFPSHDEFVAGILCEHNSGDAAAFAAAILREYNYNPDEPRDEKGRWTTGGSGTIGSQGGSRISFDDWLDAVKYGVSPVSDDVPAQPRAGPKPRAVAPVPGVALPPDLPGALPATINDAYRRQLGAGVPPKAQEIAKELKDNELAQKTVADRLRELHDQMARDEARGENADSALIQDALAQFRTYLDKQTNLDRQRARLEYQLKSLFDQWQRDRADKP